MEFRIVKGMALVALWMGAMVGLRAQTVVEYIHTDALGTPVAVTNAAGTVIERSVYEPYGQLINRPLTDGPGFTGHVQDAATGLTYMQQRYYDPLIGRFLSVDPINADGNTGAKFNRYMYALNNPYKFTDPDGRDDNSIYGDPNRMMAQPSGEGAGLVADFIPIVSDIKAGIEAFQDPSFVNISAAVVGLVPGAGDVAGKIIKHGDEVAGATKAIAGSNRAENIAKGIPESQLGPSGNPKIHSVQTSSIKESKDAARDSVGKGGTTVKHASPAKGGPHHHGVKSDGTKDRVHYEYPKSKK